VKDISHAVGNLSGDLRLVSGGYRSVLIYATMTFPLSNSNPNYPQLLHEVVRRGSNLTETWQQVCQNLGF